MNTGEKSNIEYMRPVEESGRFFGFWSYFFMWVSSVVIIAWWLMGENAVPPAGPLNWIQAIVAAFVSHIVMALGVWINGRAGLVHGIPYVIQSRSSFGIYGAKIPNFVRAIPAICWFSIESWLGALAFAGGLRILFGMSASFVNTFIVFLIFQAVQTILTLKGIEVLKSVVSYIAIYLIPIWLYIGYNIYKTVGFGAASHIEHTGSWGLPFWFIVTAFLGILTTAMLNASDYNRFYHGGIKSSTENFFSTLLGIVPMGVMLVVLGIVAGAGTGIYDPVEIMILHTPNKVVLILLLLFIALAQWGTNISLNIIPPATAFMELFGGMSWKNAVILTGILGTLTFPWWLMSAGIFMWFMVVYSAFLGPLFGIMVVDYYFIWKQKPNIKNLYNPKHPDIYYDNGWNLAGIIALIIGSIGSFIVKEISWFIGAPIGGIAYYILVKTWYQRIHSNIGIINLETSEK